MGRLSKKEVKHVAKLASLKLSSTEETKFANQLSEVISYIQELNKVNTSETEPTSQTTGIENFLREDRQNLENDLTQEESISGTEKVHNGYFIVPMVLEERTDY